MGNYWLDQEMAEEKAAADTYAYEPTLAELAALAGKSLPSGHILVSHGVDTFTTSAKTFSGRGSTLTAVPSGVTTCSGSDTFRTATPETAGVVAKDGTQKDKEATVFTFSFNGECGSNFKIKTPLGREVGMHKVTIRGYSYSETRAFESSVAWYTFDDGTGAAPVYCNSLVVNDGCNVEAKLGFEDGHTTIYLTGVPGGYFVRFAGTYQTSINSPRLEGWSVAGGEPQPSTPLTTISKGSTDVATLIAENEKLKREAEERELRFQETVDNYEREILLLLSKLDVEREEAAKYDGTGVGSGIKYFIDGWLFLDAASVYDGKPRTVNLIGYGLGDWEALWKTPNGYRVQIVSDTAGDGWEMVAMKDGDDGSIKLGTGEAPKPCSYRWVYTTSETETGENPMQGFDISRYVDAAEADEKTEIKWSNTGVSKWHLYCHPGDNSFFMYDYVQGTDPDEDEDEEEGGDDQPV